MKKIFNALLITSALLFTSSAMAGACGMNANNTQAAFSAELCSTSPATELLARSNPDLIENNPLLFENELQTNYQKRLQDDPEFAKQVQSNKENLTTTNNNFLYILWILCGIAFIATLITFTLIRFHGTEEDEGRYSFKKTGLVVCFSIVAFLLPVGTYSIGGWVGANVVIGSEKAASLVLRTLMIVVDAFSAEDGQEYSSIDQYNKSRVTVNYSKKESEDIILKMIETYGSMRQTDKALMSSFESRYAKLADPSTFYHYVDNRLEMYRTAPNSAVVDYTGGVHVIPAPSLDYVDGKLGELNLEQYVTDDIGQLETNLITARQAILEKIDTTKDSLTPVDTIIDIITLRSRKEMLVKFYKQIIADGTLDAIEFEILKQACFDSSESDHSKRYLAYLNGTGRYEGNPFCLHPKDNSGKNFELVGQGYTALDSKGAVRTLQESWYANQKKLTKQLIDRRHELISQIAAIRISVGITDQSKASTILAASSYMGFIVGSTEYLWNVEDKQRIVKSMFLGSGEKIISKGYENNLINYEFLNKGGMAAYSASTLKFGYYFRLIEREIRNGRESSSHEMTTDTIIENAIETSSSYSDIATGMEKAFTQPLDGYYAALGLVGECRDTGISCRNPVTNVLKNTVELGNNFIDIGAKGLVYAATATLITNFVDLKTSGKSSEKGSVGDQKKNKKFANNTNKYAGLTQMLSGITGAVMTYILLAGVFLAKVLPFAFNSPLLMAAIMIVMAQTMFPVLINFFAVFLMSPQAKDNYEHIFDRIKAVLLIMFILPSMLVIIKTLSFIIVSPIMYVIVLILYNGMPIDGFTGMLVCVTVISGCLLFTITSIVGLCWTISAMLLNLIGMDDLFGDEPMKLNNKINVFFGKIIPGISATKELFLNNASKGARKFSRRTKK